MDALRPALSPVQHTFSFCEEDVCFFTLFFFCLYQDEAHSIHGLRRIHVSKWICASKFADVQAYS